MSALTEVMSTYYTKKWAKMYGLDIKYADEALKMIDEISAETDYDVDIIEAVVLSSYPLNPPETIFDKLERSSKGKNAGKLVKFCRY